MQKDSLVLSIRINRVPNFLGFALPFPLALVGAIKISDLDVVLSVLYFLRSGFQRRVISLFPTILIFVISISFIFGGLHLNIAKDFINSLFVLLAFTVFTGIGYNKAKYTLKFILIGALVSLLISCFEKYLINFNLGTQYYSSSGKAIQGFVTDPNRFGLLLCSSLLIAFELLGHYKWVKKLIISFLIVGIVLTNSRGALVVGLVITTIYTYPSLKIFAKGIFFAFLAFGFMNFKVIFNLHPKFLLKSFSLIEDARYKYLNEIFTSGKLEFFGNGFGSVFRDFDVTSHNTFLEIFYSFGVIGLVLYIFMVITIIRRIGLRSKLGFSLFFLAMAYSMIMNLMFNLFFFSFLAIIYSYGHDKRSVGDLQGRRAFVVYSK